VIAYIDEIMPAIISIALATRPDADRLCETASRVQHDRQRVLLTRDGKPIAAVVPIEDLEALQALESEEDAHWSVVAEEAVGTWDSEGRPPGTPHEVLLSRYGIAADDK